MSDLWWFDSIFLLPACFPPGIDLMRLTSQLINARCVAKDAILSGKSTTCGYLANYCFHVFVGLGVYRVDKLLCEVV